MTWLAKPKSKLQLGDDIVYGLRRLQALLILYLNAMPADVQLSGWHDGKRTVHINRAIELAVQRNDLRMFIDPLGADLARSPYRTAAPGQIRVVTPLEDLFRQVLIGASRRGLREILAATESSMPR